MGVGLHSHPRPGISLTLEPLTPVFSNYLTLFLCPGPLVTERLHCWMKIVSQNACSWNLPQVFPLLSVAPRKILCPSLHPSSPDCWPRHSANIYSHWRPPVRHHVQPLPPQHFSQEPADWIQCFLDSHSFQIFRSFVSLIFGFLVFVIEEIEHMASLPGSFVPAPRPLLTKLVELILQDFAGIWVNSTDVEWTQICSMPTGAHLPIHRKKDLGREKHVSQNQKTCKEVFMQINWSLRDKCDAHIYNL